VPVTASADGVIRSESGYSSEGEKNEKNMFFLCLIHDNGSFTVFVCDFLSTKIVKQGNSRK